jgi:hypothetical protein
MGDAFDTEYKKYNDDLQLWEESLCLIIREPNRSEIEKIFELSVQQMREEKTMILAEYAFMLSQYLMFLQKKSNECDGFLKWAKNITGRLFNEDKAKAGRLVQKVELRLSRIAYLSRRIELFCQAIQGIVRQRNLEEKHG